MVMLLMLSGHLRAALVPTNMSQVTPLQVATELVGPGILSISNVTYVGATIAAGKFSGGQNIVGFDTGVVFSSGNIGTIVGPNNSGAASTNNQRPGDPDLTTLSGFTTFDASVLEFDFVPDKAHVFIQYVFASEEYNEFVNRKNAAGKLFNDTFAFFINGVNCATVAGAPVTIQTINGGGPVLGTAPISNPQLFINNDFQRTPAPLDTQMDGLTKVLTCQATVTPNATNHIKLAIADASDANLDSDVFLRSASFTTTPPLTIRKTTNTKDTDSDTATGPMIAANGPVRWTYLVTNSGGDATVDTLTSVTVTDDKVSNISCDQPMPATLGPKATMTCTATGTAVAGQYTNTGTVTGSSAILAQVTDSNPDRYFGALPVVHIVTRTNHTDNNDATGARSIQVGQPIIWTYDVTNDGNVPLEGVTVTDTSGVAVSCDIVPGGSNSTLPVHGMMSCFANGTATAGPHENIGKVSASIQVVNVSGDPETVTVTDQDPEHYVGVNPKLAIVKKTGGFHNAAAPGPYVLVGDDVSWSYAVTNTGDVTITDVAVKDDKLGDICTLGTLEVGQTLSCPNKTAKAQKGQYSNTGTASGRYGPVTTPTSPNETVTVTDSDHGYYFGADPHVSIVKKTNGTDNDTGTGPSVLVGDPVVWTYTIRNTGNVPLANVTITDDKLGTVCTIANLPADESTVDCTKSGTAARGPYTNTGTVQTSVETVLADGQTKTTPVSASNIDHYYGVDPRLAIAKKTNGFDNNTAPGRLLLVGDPVVWTYTVRNTGNVRLTNITVVDDKEGQICIIPALDPDTDAPDCTRSSTVKRDQYVNTGTASTLFVLTQPDGQQRTVTVRASDVDYYYGADPHVTIVKKTNGIDSDAAPGAYVLVGDPLVWTYTLTNDGNVPLSNVVVTDDKAGAICTLASLPVSPPLSDCTKTSIAVAGPYENTGTVSASITVSAPDGTSKTVTVTASNIDHYTGVDPRLTLVKTTNGLNSDTPPGAYVLVGDPVSWTYTVSNAGNVPLSHISIVDDREGSICTIDAVGVGQSASPCIRSGTAKAGAYTNTGTASTTIETVLPGAQKKQVPVSASNVDHYFGADPRMTLVKKTNSFDSDTPPGAFVLVGDPVVWTYSVKNTGNVPLANVTVADDKAGAICTLASLPVGNDTVDCTKASVAAKGQYQNTGTASTTFTFSQADGTQRTVPVNASNVDHYFGGAPHLTLVKKTIALDNNIGPGPTILAGSSVKWTYDVTNDGNMPLTNVIVSDDKEGVICTLASIAVDQTLQCAKISPAKAGLYENRGTAAVTVVFTTPDGGTKNVPLSATDLDHYFGADPRLAIVKKTVVFAQKPPHDRFECDAPMGNKRDDHGYDDKYGKDKYGKDERNGKGDKDWRDDRSSKDDRYSKDGPYSKDDGDAKDDKYSKDDRYSKDDTSSKDTDKDSSFGRKQRDDDHGFGFDRDYGDCLKADKSGWGDDSRDSRYGGGSKPEDTPLETDNNEAPGPFVPVGTAIGWTYTVTNVGNVALANVTVVDDKEGLICTIGPLNSGQTTVCTKTGVAQPGPYENTGTASGTFGPVYVEGTIRTVTVTASDVDHYTGAQPEIEIVKYTNGVNHDELPGAFVLAGSRVTWTYVVWNTGNLPLTNVTVTDDQIGVISCPANSLTVFPDEGSTMTCEASGRAQSGQYTNVGTVSGRSALGTVTASDADYYWGLDKKRFIGPSCD